VKQAGVVHAAGGVVRLLKWADYPADWDPTTDQRLPVWEALHHLIRVFKSEGESGTGAVLAAIHGKAESVRQLAYRLYTLCERKKRAAEALSYNGLVQSWPEITRLAREGGKPRTAQGGLFEANEE
jgi:putative DNA methylase